MEKNMSVSDEEPYSTIFSSLKHPIRRRILRMLSERPMSFSEMLEALGVSSSFLTYHLENLGELVGKTDDGRYRLSSFGEAAMSTMAKVEDIPTTASQQSPRTKPKRVVGSITMALGIICILLIASMGGVMAYYSAINNNKENRLESANKMIGQLNTNATNLQNHAMQLQKWLDGNETLLSQIQANNMRLQNEIDSLNSDVTILQDQDFRMGNTGNSTTVVNNILHTQTLHAEEGTPAIGFFTYFPPVLFAGYVSINPTHVPPGTCILNGTSFNGTHYIIKYTLLGPPPHCNVSVSLER